MSDSLQWPDSFPRTSSADRTSYPGGFRVTRSEAFQNVLDELATWDGITDVRLESGAEHQTQNPNKPYANASVEDPGVVAYFTKDSEQMAAACDRWDNLRDNAQDLYHFLHETRMQEQRGTVTAESEYQKLRLPSADETEDETAQSPYEILGVTEDASSDKIREAYRERVKETHPDTGGDEDEFKQVNVAYRAITAPEGGER
ncbi:J domain-containing protein [Natrialba asiatica]|uniref:Dnaj-like protein n=1 Tax=Natrialba asiatica (strain ATCC 700177 / DSM 12278 / JCM 9576 / FERM P-10747 / NBRC 102637 / 172P1) TaxID=29540 RepID=M0APZ4_NATA1|nr:J domain-containing protein [Natrialba asiatica]ELY99453.1 dnaj-like protein [Natrialba asiatica DSM 12278]